MAIHWQIKFKSLSEELYTVNIYDDDFSGLTPVQLIGASQPFVTQEDNDNDIFIPVRRQTGYIRIVDTGEDLGGNAFDWRDLVPETGTSRKVTLTNSSNAVQWSGYIQPQTFSGDFAPYPIERAFPIVCQLGVLEGFDVEPSAGDIDNFAYLLYYILSLPSGNSFANVYFQGSEVINEWLTKKVQWSNFVAYDDDGNAIAKYKTFDVLKEICTFFGWTARTHGQDLIFAAGDENFDVPWQYIDFQDVREMGEGRQVSPTTIATWPLLTATVQDYATSDGTETIGLGFHKATVRANINKRDTIIKIPYNEIAELYRGDAMQATMYGTDGFYFHKGPDDTNPHNYHMGGVLLQLSGGYPTAGAYFDSYEYFEGDITLKHNYNLKNKITLYGGPGMLVLDTDEAYSFDHGTLTFNARTFLDTIENGEHKRYNAQGRLYCKLRIGNQWYDEVDGWNDDPSSSFIIYIGTDEGTEGEGEGYIVGNSWIGRIVNNQYMDNPNGTFEGKGVFITTQIGGKIHFEINNFQLDNNHGVAQGPSIEDFVIGFTRDKTYVLYNDRSENIYKQENASEFAEEREVSTIFASDNKNAMGVGIILNDDNSYCEKITFSMSGGGGLEHPEQHLANRMSAWGARPSVRYDVSVLSDHFPTLSPICRFSPLTGKTTYPIAISRDWRDDVTKLKLIEL